MGKLGKSAKRRRLMDAASEAASFADAPSGGASGGVAAAGVGAGDDGGISAADLAATARTLHALGGRLDIFASPRCKALRVSLAPLAAALLAKPGARPNGADGAAAVAVGSLVGRVSEALRYGRWAAAVDLLRALVAAGVAPKLGSAQRWVRDIDACREVVPGPRWRALEMVVRACAATDARAGAGCVAPGPATAPPATSPVVTVVRRMPRFRVPAAAAGAAAVAAATSVAAAATSAAADADADAVTGGAVAPCGGAPAAASAASAAALRAAFTVVSHTPAARRQPPNRFDQTIYAGAAAALAPDRPAAVITSVPVPAVPGARLVAGVLSPAECASIVSAADALGWVPDEVLAVGGGYDDDDNGGGAGDGGELRAGNVVWLADDAFVARLLARLRPHLPPALRGGALVGINARCRLYRYGTDARYRPHIDGAWPGSGMVDGAYAYDALRGAAWSRLTVVVYLNEGFAGGDTVFYLPGEAEGELRAHGVVPAVGAVLVFPHGDTPHPNPRVDGGFLVHEGSVVTEGVKLILRTDVLYEVPAPAPRPGAALAAGGRPAHAPSSAAARA